MYLCSYYSFIWLNLFWHVVANKFLALGLSLFCLLFVIFVTSMYSAVGRVIMYSGALGDEDIMQENIGYSERMTGPELATALVEKTKMAKAAEVRYEIKSTHTLW